MTDEELIGEEFVLDGVTFVVKSVTPDVAKCSVKGARGRPKNIKRQRVELLVSHVPVLEQVELPLIESESASVSELLAVNVPTAE